MFIVTYKDKNQNIRTIYAKNKYENAEKIEEQLRKGLQLDDIISIKETPKK